MEKATPEKIMQLIAEAEVLDDPAELEPQSSLEDQGLDSIDFLKLYLAVEEAYGIKIPDEDMPGLGSVESIVAYVNTKI